MNIKTLITVTLLSLSLSMAVQGDVVSQAYEIALGDFREPATENGGASFKACDDCERKLVRVTAATRYTINGEPVRFADFRRVIRDARSRSSAALTVLHHIQSDTIESISTAPEGMSLAATKVIPTGTVMSYSYSSTVIELLTRVKPRRVIISEARPTNEGIRVAKTMVRAGISMTMITEAQMALFVNEADAVMVGADSVLPDGDFINKIGTRLLALAARDAEVPFYTATETLKVTAPSEPMPFAPEEGQAKEICSENWLEVRNVYYEVTPARLVTSYITEQGVLDPAEMHTFAAAAEKHWQRLMNSHEA